MAAGFAIIILITFAGLVLLVASFIFWTSPRLTRRLEEILGIMEKREAELSGRLSNIARCGHSLTHYIHLHSLSSAHSPYSKR